MSKSGFRISLSSFSSFGAVKKLFDTSSFNKKAPLFFLYLGFLGGSWNIAFIHEDAFNKGVIAHELAHTVGQGREFYEPNEVCRQFKGKSSTTCKDYKIPFALNTRTDKDGQHWKFLRDKLSIMNNKPDIHNIWIDRETYQKIFKVLSKEAVIENTEELHEYPITLNYRRERQSSLKAITTGFYYEEKEVFIVPDIKIRETKLLTLSFSPDTQDTKLSVVTFQLREGEKILQEIRRPILPLQIKTLYKDKLPETEPFDFSPFMVIFNLPQDYKERHLEIVALSPKGKKIYSAPVFKKQNIAWIDNIAGQ